MKKFIQGDNLQSKYNYVSENSLRPKKMTQIKQQTLEMSYKIACVNQNTKKLAMEQLYEGPIFQPFYLQTQWTCRYYQWGTLQEDWESMNNICRKYREDEPNHVPMYEP